MLWKFNYVYKYFSEFSILINSKFLLIILPIIFTEQFCFKKRILHWWAKSVLGLRPDLARPSLLLITKIKKTKKMWYTVFPFFCHPSERCIFAKVELRWPRCHENHYAKLNILDEKVEKFFWSKLFFLLRKKKVW